VELEVRGGVLELLPRVGRPVEVDAVRADRVRQRHAVPIRQLPELVLVSHRARGGTRPEQRTPEARALLVGPADEPHGDRWLALLRDSAEHLGAGDHVQRAVEPAAVRDRVEVAADQQLLVGAAVERPPLVARLVERHLRAGAFELRGHPLLRLHPGVGPRNPLGAVLVARELAELLQLGDGTAGIERHWRELKTW
jgi:hypothetical protein